ncbi:unnamed protein product [Macrosiphum euphorbiae]|uniref:Uncharacterized protein n=1 Tax=Macrosiphum euphorbiae TaxID=13131 RepID=A0AAV0WIG9_9HEMI|nr:unnamed protein product [Macrosiphum euphorbiae]
MSSQPPSNHEEEEAGAPNIHLQDHTYARQLPVVQIQPQQEEDRNAQEDGIAPDEEEAPVHDEEQEDGPASDEDQNNGPQDLVIYAEPKTYRTIPGIRLNSKFYFDSIIVENRQCRKYTRVLSVQ